MNLVSELFIYFNWPHTWQLANHWMTS